VKIVKSKKANLKIILKVKLQTKDVFDL